MSSSFIGKPTLEVKAVKNAQPRFKSTPESNQKPACAASFSNAVPSDKKFSTSQRPISSSPNVGTYLKVSSGAPGGGGDFQMSSPYDDLPSEEMRSAELEPQTQPPPEPVDNIPPSPFTLRASNPKKYKRPNRLNQTASEPAENNDKPSETASALVKPNSVLPAGASSTASGTKTAAKPPGRGGGRVRDYTVLHPSCLSVCNVTIQDSIERSGDELVTPAAPADVGDVGQMKKKSEAPAPKTNR